MRKDFYSSKMLLSLATAAVMGVAAPTAVWAQQPSQQIAQQQPAQSGVLVTGTVFDLHGEALEGAQVRATLGKKVWSAAVNREGFFELRLPSEALAAGVALRASYIGMENGVLRLVAGKTRYDFLLKDNHRSIGETVVTGYGTISAREKTSAITSLKMDEILMPGMTTLDQALEGRVPDLVFMQNSGEVGATARMRIRGTSTLIGNREPLWVLDGIPLTDPVGVTNDQLNDPDYINYIGNAISGINPQDIERVDVLKDAAATALYGVRATNGVIVVTTKKGEPGPPRITYNTQFKFTERPRYSDRSINVMNSQERVQFGKDLVDLHYAFPSQMTLVGYEGAYYRYATGQSSYEDFVAEVRQAETTNTDWFSLLTRDTFNHNHTVSLSGGGETARYYASVGYNKENGTQLKHRSDRYTATLNMQTKIANLIQANIRVNASVQKRDNMPSEVDLLGYAYNTTRALPVRNADGSYYYYQRKAYNNTVTQRTYDKYRYNILNEIDNIERTYESSNLMAAIDLRYRWKELIEFSLTTSYQRNNANEGTWYGERSNYVAQMKNAEYEADPLPGRSGRAELLYGGLYNFNNSVNESYLIRGQADLRKSFGDQAQHRIYAMLNYEVSSTNVVGVSQATRGFLKDRGLQYFSFNSLEELNKYPLYAEWLAGVPAPSTASVSPAPSYPIHTNEKTNLLQGAGLFSYSYADYVTLGMNVHFDASNKFGSRSNERFLPVWSVSTMVNLKDIFVRNAQWLSDARLRASYGRTGMMVDGQTPNLLLRKLPYSLYYGENVSKVSSLPNPNLRWEQTDASDLGLDLSLFDYRLSFSFDAYYKHTHDAFVNTPVSTINGVSQYTMNGADVFNSGFSFTLSGYPIRNRDWTLYLSTNYSYNHNRVEAKTANNYRINDYLGGTAIVDGQAVSTFYSYAFVGLDPTNGLPLFDDYRDRRFVLEGLTLEETVLKVLARSGRREPVFSGAFYVNLRYKQLSLNSSFNYALGHKIRKFALYKDVIGGISSEANVRKEFVDRWRNPGDELHTNYPSLIASESEFYTDAYQHWSTQQPSLQSVSTFAENIWTMYDNSTLRVVPGDYLRLSNLTLRYQFSSKQLRALPFKTLTIDATMTNVFTLKSSKLDGQDPSQTNFIDRSGLLTTTLSLRPAYTLGLRVGF